MVAAIHLGGSRSFGTSEGRGGRVQEIEPGAQAHHGERMNLGDTRFAGAERGCDRFHGEFFIIVKRENALLLFRQFGNGLFEQMLYLIIGVACFRESVVSRWSLVVRGSSFS